MKTVPVTPASQDVHSVTGEELVIAAPAERSIVSPAC
jgi:hypothetical protein